MGQSPYDPFHNPGISTIVKCPVCGESDFDVRQNQYGITRICRNQDCKNRWSGGTMGAAKPDSSENPPLPGVAAPEDLPVEQFTGGSYRRFGNDD